MYSRSVIFKLKGTIGSCNVPVNSIDYHHRMLG